MPLAGGREPLVRGLAWGLGHLHGASYPRLCSGPEARPWCVCWGPGLSLFPVLGVLSF